MTNEKYEITDIAHPGYPFLHRIRALRDIGEDVKAGDLGGFVEHEGNLSFEPGDDAWIYDDAIAANESHVEDGAILRDHAVVCGMAKVKWCAIMTDHARAEDHADVDGARVVDHARLSGFGLVCAITPARVPVVGGNSIVHGSVVGNVRLTGEAVVFSRARIYNEAIDQVVVDENGQRVERSPDRDRLVPGKEYFVRSRPKWEQGHKREEVQR